MPFAIVDVGTNTAKLLVAEHAEDGLRTVRETARVVRLGEGLDRSGHVTDAALVRLRAALQAFVAIADEEEAAIVSVCGTSASRDAANARTLRALVHEATGCAYEILSGEEEARWTYVGTCSAFDDLEGAAVVLDIGGGSTEFVLGLAGQRIIFWRSLQVGTVRLTERCFTTQPPAPQEVTAAEAMMDDLLNDVQVPLAPDTTFVGGSGTVRVLARLAGCPIPGALGAGTVRRWRDRLLAMSYDETFALDPTLMQGRADVFAAGVLVLDAVMTRFGLAACRVSPHGLRHGLVLRAAGARRKDAT